MIRPHQEYEPLHRARVDDRGRRGQPPQGTGSHCLGPRRRRRRRDIGRRGQPPQAGDGERFFRHSSPLRYRQPAKCIKQELAYPDAIESKVFVDEITQTDAFDPKFEIATQIDRPIIYSCILCYKRFRSSDKMVSL